MNFEDITISQQLMDDMFGSAHDLLTAGRYDYINFLLRYLDPKGMPLEYVIGMLTITAPWKAHLSCRPEFYTQALKQHEYQDGSPERHTPLKQVHAAFRGLE